MFSFSQNYLTRGFWGDEAWTSLISQLPYLQMLKTTAADFHPPAYYTIIEFWYKVFPPTEIATRLVSIIFYILTVFLVYKLASRVSNRNLFGSLSAIVAALNPVFFTYAFEARNYTMFAFCAVGSIYYLIRISERFDKISAAAFLFFSTLGIYTHYYMFFVLGAQGLYLILFDRKIFPKMMGLYVLSVILYLPWLPFLFGQLKSVAGDYWIGGIDRHTHYEALLRILGGEQKNTIRPWLFSLSLILLLIGVFQHLVRHKFEKPYLLIWLWAVVPFILASLPGLKIDGFKFPFRPIFFWRYLIGASIPLTMVIVHSAQKLPKYLFISSMVIIILLSLAIDIAAFSHTPHTFRDEYQAKILPQIKNNDKIVTVLPSFAEALYYRNRFDLKNDLIVLPEGLVQFSGKSLLDAYVKNGTVTIAEAPTRNYFELKPGPTVMFKN